MVSSKTSLNFGLRYFVSAAVWGVLLVVMVVPSLGWGEGGGSDSDTPGRQSSPAVNNTKSGLENAPDYCGGLQQGAPLMAATSANTLVADEIKVSVQKVKTQSVESVTSRMLEWVNACGKAHTAAAECYTDLNTAVTKINSTLATKCSGMSGGIGGFLNAGAASEGLTEAQKISADQTLACTGKTEKFQCLEKCLPSDLLAKYETDKANAEKDPATVDANMKIIDAFYQQASTLEGDSCVKKQAAVIEKFGELLGTATLIQKGAESTRNMFAAGAAAVGAGAYLYKKKKDDDKNDDEKKEKKKATEEFESGIARTATGEKINCLLPETYADLECRKVLISYCGKPENSSKAGCDAFKIAYCNDPDAPGSYCLAAASKNYCANSSDGVDKSQSPSCSWMTGRPSTCLSKPDDISCMVKMSAADLTNKCISYESDPLCQAHANGKVITQPTASSFTASTASAGSGLNELLNGKRNTASTSGALLGSQTTTYQQLCESGQLVNCN